MRDCTHAKALRLLPAAWRMLVTHLSTSDIQGGAARAAHRLHAGLGKIGVDSSMLVWRRSSEEPRVRKYEGRRNLLSRARRRVQGWRMRRDADIYQSTRPAGLERFSDDRSWALDLGAHLGVCDVVNLHWVAGFVDYGSFFRSVPERIPIVWTLHDMNPFTGGCHYDCGCDRWQRHCGNCPQLGSDTERDLAYAVWERKQEAFASIPSGRLQIVAPSRWLADEARRSSLLGRFPAVVIPNGLDTGCFVPKTKNAAREALGLPARTSVVLFVADSAGNSRKGFSYLREALRGMNGSADLILCSLGCGEPRLDSSVRHVHLGSVANDRLLAAVYSAADVFVIPSLQDNLPNTVMEAMACGTPVVGFDIGGIPDMVRPGETGLLVPARDTPALRGAIERLLGDDAMRERLGRRCREVVGAEYTLERQAREYATLYERLARGAQPQERMSH